MNWLKRLWAFAATAVSVLPYLLLDQVRSWVDAHGFWLYVAGVVLITLSVYLAEYANEWRKNRKSIAASSSAARVEEARAVTERDVALAAKETAEESLAAARVDLATEQEAHNRSRQQNTERLREAAQERERDVADLVARLEEKQRFADEAGRLALDLANVVRRTVRLDEPWPMQPPRATLSEILRVRGDHTKDRLSDLTAQLGPHPEDAAAIGISAVEEVRRFAEVVVRVLDAFPGASSYYPFLHTLLRDLKPAGLSVATIDDGWHLVKMVGAYDAGGPAPEIPDQTPELVKGVLERATSITERLTIWSARTANTLDPPESVAWVEDNLLQIKDDLAKVDALFPDEQDRLHE